MIERKQEMWPSVLLVAVVLAVCPAGGRAAEDRPDFGDTGAHCSSTARTVFSACEAEARADALIAAGKCLNIGDSRARRECLDEAQSDRDEALRLCRSQRSARFEACHLVGEARYEPDFDPARFDTDPGHASNPNPYFPLTVGNRWEYDGAETVKVEVKDERKRIEGVTCIVVRDRVFDQGVVVEDTDDWFAQALDGDVFYAGEQTAEFETFDGDIPKKPERVSIEGSFKAGREGDKPGIGFLASPAVGDVYRQEFSLDNAEDIARIVSTTYSFGDDADLDRFVPQELAEALCDHDCIVVEEFTPLEPGAIGRKYYAVGIGDFLEIDPASGDVVQLVHCNFDTRCQGLPGPE
jgi:hypothetical protein